MKRGIAIIKPFKLDTVREALHEIHNEGMTVTEVVNQHRSFSPALRAYLWLLKFSNHASH